MTLKKFIGMSADIDLTPIKILYERDGVLMVDKPPDVRINSDDPEDTTNVATRLAKQCPHLVDPAVQHSFRFSHRLDMATSGVLCLTLNKEAARIVGKAFEKRRVRKHYLALVRGHVIPDVSGLEKDGVTWCTENDVAVCEVDVATGRDRSYSEIHRHCVASASSSCESPRRARTTLTPLQHGLYSGQPASKVLLEPHTGRTHQLRIHCAYLGHTIVGDYMYSDGTDTQPPRMMLHATRLHVNSCTSGRRKFRLQEALSVCSPDPLTPENHPEWTVSRVLASFHAHSGTVTSHTHPDVTSHSHPD